MTRLLPILVAAVLAGAIAGGVVGRLLGGEGAVATTREAGKSVSSTRLPRDTSAAEHVLTASEVYESAAPGVVVVTDTQTVTIPPTTFTPSHRQLVRALGSGFVIDTRGDIVTNEHVVHDAKGIRVGFSSGASFAATIVGMDPSTDIAVVRVKAPPSVLQPLAFDDSSAVRVGDPVYAIGNPFGLDRTMTAGIVSTTGRDIEAPNDLTIPNAIQTDATINHGNSGGPLLDASGRVVGVNAQIQGGTVDANVGIGFAIAGNTAQSVAEQLIATGRSEHAWLGIVIETIDPSVAKIVQGLPERGVVVVRVVKGSPAAKAGLVAARQRVTAGGIGAFVGGDAIVAVDETPIATPAEVADLVAEHKPGDKLTLEIVRGEVRRAVAVTLGNVPG